MNKILITILIIIAAVSAEVFPNPLLSSEKSENSRKRVIENPVIAKGITARIAPIQRKLNGNLSSRINAVKENKDIRIFILILLIAFVYGMIHAVGPGHGKTLIFSYFLSNKAKKRKGIFSGLTVAALHALSTLILIGILYLIIHQSKLFAFTNIRRIIQLVSYGFISLIGIVFIIRSLKKKNLEEHDHEHDHKNLLHILVPIGLIPCPITMFIVLFCINNNVMMLGLIIVLFLALGMAVTVSSSGIIAIYGRKALLNFFIDNKDLFYRISNVIEIIGAVLITIIGLLLLLMTI